jgi:hypothetical protein
MKFSYTELWNDTVRMLQSNLAILVALAGVFIFLPNLLIIHFFPAPPEVAPDEALRVLLEYWRAIAPWALLSQIVQMIGGISIYLILLGKRGSTVGGVIATSLVILPFYFLASLISGFIVFAGLILLIVPGLYLFARLVPLGPVVVAEGTRNPIETIRRAFALSRGNGWAILGLFMLIAIAGTVAGKVLVWLLGILFVYLASQDIADLLTQIVQALATSALALVIVVLAAAVYRALAGEKSA